MTNINTELKPRERLRLEIQRAGKTEAQAAVILGIHRGTFSFLLTGKWNPTEPQKQAIEREFGVPANSWPQV